MKTNRSLLFCGLLTGLLASSGRSQDIVYFANDDTAVLNTRITDAVNDKLILTVQRAGIAHDYIFTRSRIALAFTRGATTY